MSKKKSYKKSKKVKKRAKEPVMKYGRTLKIFKSFEEQEEYNRRQMALLKPIEILQHLRKMINIAYGMHGYNPDKLPKKHKITFL